eukprot:4880036-Pyramimonas_sp.AAC.1
MGQGHRQGPRLRQLLCRGPTPGRAHRTGGVPTLEGRTRDASSTRRGTDKLLATSSKAPGMAPRDKRVESYNSREKTRQDFDVRTPTGTPRTPGETAGVAMSAASAPAPAAPVSSTLRGATCSEFRGATCS